MVKALILDLDGTLVESHEAHVKSYKGVFDNLGLKASHKDLKKHFGKIAEDIIKEVFPQLTNKQVIEVVMAKRELFLQNLEAVYKKPCADSFISKASKNYFLAIATSASREEMNALLKKFSWINYFKVLVTSYDVLKPKPAPDLLFRVAELLKLEVNDCLFIGDSIYDALAAREAGMSFLGVETGSFSKNDFKKEGFKSYRNLCTLSRSKFVFF